MQHVHDPYTCRQQQQQQQQGGCSTQVPCRCVAVHAHCTVQVLQRMSGRLSPQAAGVVLPKPLLHRAAGLGMSAGVYGPPYTPRIYRIYAYTGRIKRIS
jgi:hypothetical protein